MIGYGRLVWVCGGRGYLTQSQKSKVFKALENSIKTDDLIVQGGAPGIDKATREWCALKNRPCLTMHAWWGSAGKKAGPQRNEWMAKMSPSILLAFPGGPGTDNSKSFAAQYGVSVVEVMM